MENRCENCKHYFESSEGKCECHFWNDVVVKVHKDWNCDLYENKVQEYKFPYNC